MSTDSIAVLDRTAALDAQSPALHELIRAHTYAAFAGLLLSSLFGILVSIKFYAPAFLGGHAWDTWGRLRYDHTQGIPYAWLGNAFIAFLYYSVPLLAGRGITSVRLGWVLFWVWNVAVLGGWSLVLAGMSQPLEWAEFPLPIAAVIRSFYQSPASPGPRSPSAMAQADKGAQ